MQINYGKPAILNFLFFDSEVVRIYETYEAFIKAGRDAGLWSKMAKRYVKEEGITEAEAYEKYAGLYPEYSKVVAIGVGKFVKDKDGVYTKNIAPLTAPDEKSLLEKFVYFINNKTIENTSLVLCGHNIMEFDIPFLIKRMIFHGIKIPFIFYTFLYGKPWEVNIADTIKDYRMGGNRMMAQDAIAEFLGIPSSKKGEVNGETLGEFYYAKLKKGENPLDHINQYVCDDVRVLMDIVDKFGESISRAE